MEVRNLQKIPAVKAMMTPFPWFIHIGERLDRARELMAQHEIRHLPVMEEDALVGVLTERDIALVLGRVTGASDRERLSVRDACVRDAYVVELSEPLDRVLLTMAERHIGSALVVKNRKLVGIFTVTDACHRFGEFLRSLFPPGPDDEAA